jgi:dihydroorotate dehydrogenase
MTNSIALPVRRTSGEWLFGGERRGICGQAIRDASLEQVRMVRQILSQNQLALEIIGVGGVFSAEDVRAYLDAGANTVQCATSAMLVPDLVQQVHAQWTPSA